MSKGSAFQKRLFCEASPEYVFSQLIPYEFDHRLTCWVIAFSKTIVLDNLFLESIFLNVQNDKGKSFTKIQRQRFYQPNGVWAVVVTRFICKNKKGTKKPSTR